jgi:hypothetical protein
MGDGHLSPANTNLWPVVAMTQQGKRAPVLLQNQLPGLSAETRSPFCADVPCAPKTGPIGPTGPICSRTPQGGLSWGSSWAGLRMGRRKRPAEPAQGRRDGGSSSTAALACPASARPGTYRTPASQAIAVRTHAATASLHPTHTSRQRAAPSTSRSRTAKGNSTDRAVAPQMNARRGVMPQMSSPG